MLAGPASAEAWKAERQPSRPGGVESCAVRWQPLGVSLTRSRWSDGAMTHLFTVAFAHPGATLELRTDAGARFLARASDLKYWSQAAIAEALLAGRKANLTFHDHNGKPGTAQIDLATLKAAYEACGEALASQAPSKPKAKPR
jgi:hypothetical protein